MTLHVGDCVEIMRGMEAESVDCVVTSPPYFGLRDYGVDGQIGLETTPAEYVAKMVEVFREVRRVLRPAGTCWVNLGDSYAGTGASGGGKDGARRGVDGYGGMSPNGKGTWRSPKTWGHMKIKDLMMTPHRVAIALQDDGWWVRNDHVWHKPNCMPESVRDRCTRAHEYVFQLAKSQRYWFDAGAVKEPAVHGERYHGAYDKRPTAVAEPNGRHRANISPIERRNRRSVWTIPTKPFPEAHFATFPVELARVCILAGCPEGGTVLDPFGGAGTAAVAAMEAGRRWQLIELNSEYADIARRRIEAARAPMADLWEAPS